MMTTTATTMIIVVEEMKTVPQDKRYNYNQNLFFQS
jgi:hypothetical protein